MKRVEVMWEEMREKGEKRGKKEEDRGKMQGPWEFRWKVPPEDRGNHGTS